MIAGYSRNIGRYIHEAKYKTSVRVPASLNLYSMFQGMEELLRQMWKRCNLLENEMFELRVPLHTSSCPPIGQQNTCTSLQSGYQWRYTSLYSYH
jgi:hypothetical protein